MKRLLCLCCMTALLSSCALLPVQGDPKKTTQALSTPQTSTVISTKQPTNAIEPIAYETSKIEEEGVGYIFSATFPVTGIEAIDRQIDTLIQESFTKDVAIPDLPEEPGSVTIDFDVVRNDEIFAILFDIDIFFSGAAHGFVYYVTKVYHMPSATPIALEDLFIEGSDYLGRLSKLSKEKLLVNDVDVPEDKTALSGIEWFSDGVEPKEMNFAHFLPKRDGLQIVFDNYQVAPFAVGDVRLTIGWDQLEDLLKPEWAKIVRK